MLQVLGDTAPGPVLPAKRPLACTYSYSDDTDGGVRQSGHLAAQQVWQLGTVAQPILKTLSVTPSSGVCSPMLALCDCGHVRQLTAPEYKFV
jgi:hypothetical protein